MFFYFTVDIAMGGREERDTTLKGKRLVVLNKSILREELPGQRNIK